jgi:hypothetical protein
MYPEVEIGSYPTWRKDQEKGVKVVFKSFRQEEIERAFEHLTESLKPLKIPIKTLDTSTEAYDSFC